MRRCLLQLRRLCRSDLHSHHHPLLQTVLGLRVRNLAQHIIQQHLELLHLISHRCPSFMVKNLRRNSARARITRVRTVPSGIPIASATSLDVISSTDDNTSGCLSSSGKPSISRLNTPPSSSSTAFSSGHPPTARHSLSDTSERRAAAF